MQDRVGLPPQTSSDGPHRQVADQASPAIWGQLIARATALPGVHEGWSQVSPASSRALFLDVVQTARPETSLAPPDKKLEPVHIHGVRDTSVHLCLPRDRVGDVIAAGWGEEHPNGDWHSEMMVYGPRNDDEVETVLALIEESLSWARDLNS
jgi:hypothetical protein